MESDVIALRLRGRCKGLAPTLFCFFCLLGVARPALAQAPQLPAPVPTRLTYTVASGCPDEHFFRTAVSGYLGRRDPFTATGWQSLHVKVNRTGGTFKAEIVFVDVHGERHPDKNKLDDPDCTQLVETAALVVMKWIDPVIPPLLAPVAVVPPKPVDPAPAPKPPEPPSRSEIPPDDLPPARPPPQPPPAPKPSIVRRAEAMVGSTCGRGRRPRSGSRPTSASTAPGSPWRVSFTRSRQRARPRAASTPRSSRGGRWVPATPRTVHHARRSVPCVRDGGGGRGSIARGYAFPGARGGIPCGRRRELRRRNPAQ
jgi:hypothetical protein